MCRSRTVPQFASGSTDSDRKLDCSKMADLCGRHRRRRKTSSFLYISMSGTVSSIDVVAIFTSGQPFGNRAPLTRHHNHVTETKLFPIMDTSSGIIPYVFLTDRKQCVVREAEWDRFSARGFQAHTGPLRRSLETMTTSPDRGRGGGGERRVVLKAWF